MSVNPTILEEYASFQITIKNRSVKTAHQYLSDLSLFLRFITVTRAGGDPADEKRMSEADISGVDPEFLRGIRSDEIYSFFLYTSSVRGNKPAARCRKLSAIKTFYKYLTTTRNYFKENPAANIEPPKTRPALPKFLSLDESIALLEAVEADTESKSRARDYCMITLFLNCGMRLSELCGINLVDMDPKLRSLRVIGKGSKERIVYLNDACRSSIENYLAVRAGMEIKEKNALFISSRGVRISNRTVEYTIEKYLDRAGLGYRHLSVHKLRHTAATLMYREGGVDVRVLKDILGHESLNTTQIYTHVSNQQMEEAMQKNPLAKEKKEKKSK